MNTLEAIMTRRSIRKYTSEPIPQETMETILKAGMYAPSAHNSQPWHFIVVNERDTLNALADAGDWYKMLKDAPAAIVVCGQLSLEQGGTKGRYSQDCAAATQNMLLAAHELGLGGVWLGVHLNEGQTQRVSDIVGLPSDGDVVPVSMIALGWPAQQRRQPDRFLPERIHYNTW